MQRPHRSATRNRAIGVGVIVVLLVAMALNTKFLSPTELAAALPKPFDAAATAADLYGRAKTEIPGKAQPLGEVITAIQSDPKAAATKYQAVSPTADSYVFPVTVTATVSKATDALLRLNVDGVADQTQVLVPLTTAVNGTALRDMMGFKFAEAPGQTDFQYVGDELKKLILADLGSSVTDPASLEGKKVTLVGIVSVQDTGSPPSKGKPVNVQPLTLTVGS